MKKHVLVWIQLQEQEIMVEICAEWLATLQPFWFEFPVLYPQVTRTYGSLRVVEICDEW